jgi:hypothetical protein
VQIERAADGLTMHSHLIAFESGAAIFERMWEHCFPEPGADAPDAESEC